MNLELDPFAERASSGLSGKELYAHRKRRDVFNFILFIHLFFKLPLDGGSDPWVSGGFGPTLRHFLICFMSSLDASIILIGCHFG